MIGRIGNHQVNNVVNTKGSFAQKKTPAKLPFKILTLNPANPPQLAEKYLKKFSDREIKLIKTPKGTANKTVRQAPRIKPY